jgi:glyoxylase-like metal-dependent hydrolase (beta-lactamase superfamily II)
MAVEVTGVAQERSWHGGGLPPVEQVRPGMWSIPVPLPANPLRYVLVYALETSDGVALIDTGWSTDDAWTALTAGLAQAGFGVTDVRAALITHIHPDHYGLAGRVRQVSGAWVALHPADAALLPARYGMEVPELLGHMRAFLEGCGVPDEVLDELTEASMGVREFVALAQPDVLLEDGRRVDLRGWDLRAVHTPGHSPGHVCFHDGTRRLLISGDHVLPRISPNVSLHAQQPDNPLADFLDALQRVRALDVDEVLPAHEWRFRGLQERVDELAGHHEQRLAEVDAVLQRQPGATCWEVTLRLTWSRDWAEVGGYMRRAAVGETLAHLVLLESRGQAHHEAGVPQRWYAAETGRH